MSTLNGPLVKLILTVAHVQNPKPPNLADHSMTAAQETLSDVAIQHRFQLHLGQAEGLGLRV